MIDRFLQSFSFHHMISFRVAPVAFIFTLVPAIAQEQEQENIAAKEAPADILAGHSGHGDAFNEGPRQKAYLMKGMPKVNFPVSTEDPHCQAFFNQGIGQLYGFWNFEAERSFRQAAVIDPDCAMSYWGMARANLGNETRSKGFIEEAVKRKLNISKDDVLLPNEKVFKQMLVEIQTIVDAKIPDNNLVAGYNAAFKAVNFCETLGFLEARGFIRFDDIEQIYGGWIQKVYLAMEGEVRAVRTKRGDPQILINFSNIGLQSWKTRLIREGQVSQAIALVTQLSKSQQT